jgi:hypothetical protein
MDYHLCHFLSIDLILLRQNGANGMMTDTMRLMTAASAVVILLYYRWPLMIFMMIGAPTMIPV